MFIYKGIRSIDMGLQIDGNLTFESPRRDLNLVSVAGRDGDLVMDNGRYNSITRTINCRLRTTNENVETVINRIHNWLAIDVNFHDFSWSGDPGFTYKAMIENPTRTQRVLVKLARIALNFRVHPIKYLTSSLNEQVVASGTNVENPFQLASKPVIRVVGSGNIIINIGLQVLDLRNIFQEITIDCETMTVMGHDGVAEFAKMYSTFPELRPGNNIITFTGDVQVFVTPRLGVLV